MKPVIVRVPKELPRTGPLDFRDCAPVFGAMRYKNRAERFIVPHMFGYRWMPRLKRWHIPKVPKNDREIIVVGCDCRNCQRNRNAKPQRA